MRREKQIEVGGRTVTVISPTVAALWQMLQEFQNRNILNQDIFGDHVLQEISFLEIQTFTTLTKEEIGAFCLEDLIEIAKQCQECNPLFFAWKKQVLDAGQKHLATHQTPADSSNPPSSD
ncbi:hypothetical protein SIID45300_01062 [Candidatus Magnetaquicoccaceae bacterium FCR-1]|uniref:Uncharacterized protein n=1 Tax=Candidatus Magnetaquiglobus chichijimensis TaxID=3141448 RepID=A0ABQ0C7S3_9PROT